MSQPETASTNTAELRRLLVLHFSLGELRSLCQDLGVGYEELGGETKDSKSLALIEYLNRRNRLVELVVAAQRERPQVAWESGSTGTPQAQVIPSASAARPEKTPPPQTDIHGVVQIGNPIIRAWRGVSTRISSVLQVGSGRIEVTDQPPTEEKQTHR